VATGEFVTYFEFAFFSQIDFGHFQDTCGKFVTDADVEFFAFVSSDFFTYFDAVVVQQAGDKGIGIFSLSSWCNQRLSSRFCSRSFWEKRLVPLGMISSP
jgi:hypothetical protein